MRLGFIGVLFGYLALLAAAGVFLSRKSKNLEDFFLASRRLSAGMMALSLSAAWFGASSILVSMEEACRDGVNAFWIMGLPAVLTILLLVIFLARRIHDLPTLSLSDLVEMRYGRTVRHMATGLIIWYMIMLAASQLVAAGQFLKAFLGTSYVPALVLAAVIVLGYSMWGGLKSVARADSLQFFLLAGGVLGLFLALEGRASFRQAGELASQWGKTGYFDFFHDLKRNALMAFSFVLAWTISPIAWQRIQAVRSAIKARQGLLISAGLLAVLYALIVAAGILSLPVFGVSEGSSPLVSRFIMEKAGSILGGFLFVAVMAAILSTMDAAIHTGALSLTRDVFQQIFPRNSETQLVAVSRLATFLATAAAVAVAVRFQDILMTLGLASQIMAEGLFIPGMVMLFQQKKIPQAGLLGLLFGGGFSVVSFLNDAGVFHLPLPAWPFSVPYGVALGAAGFFIGWKIAVRRR